MDTGQALTRFFQIDSTKANNLTLYPHKVEEFWLWVSSWALYISRPSDLGFEDEGYELPPMEIRPHMISENYGGAMDRDGQYKLLNDAAANLQQASREKKNSIGIRCAEAKRIVDEDPGAHFLLWHDREEERHELKRLMTETSDIYGTMDYDEREKARHGIQLRQDPPVCHKEKPERLRVQLPAVLPQGHIRGHRL